MNKVKLLFLIVISFVFLFFVSNIHSSLIGNFGIKKCYDGCTLLDFIAECRHSSNPPPPPFVTCWSEEEGFPCNYEENETYLYAMEWLHDQDCDTIIYGSPNK